MSKRNYPKMILFDYGHIEFVMTSSDYFMRKPNRILFDIALQKAGLQAEEVWYCGDNWNADVEGAAQVGISPVWYDNDTDKNGQGREYSREGRPQCEHLYIREWEEMVELLERY